MQRLTVKHQAENGESCERLGGKREQARGDKDTTTRSIESSNLGPWELIEPGPLTRDYPGAGPRTPTHL